MMPRRVCHVELRPATVSAMLLPTCDVGARFVTVTVIEREECYRESLLKRSMNGIGGRNELPSESDAHGSEQETALILSRAVNRLGRLRFQPSRPRH